MDKKQIANKLESMATLLEFHGENVFKVRAFQNAARALAAVPEPLEVLLEDPSRLEQIKGIGKSIAAVIREFATTGKCEEFEELRRRAPKGFDDLIRVPGLGPKRLKTLVEELGTQTLDQLERVCRTGEITRLPGFGEKMVEKLLAGIAQVRKFAGQWLFPQAWEYAQQLSTTLKKVQGVKQIEIAGSLRRCKEIIRDIDIVVSASNAAVVVDKFTNHPLVENVIARGQTKTSVLLSSGMQADLRVVEDDAFACALQYFTGSKEHNTKLRGHAKKLGLKLNEYGLFRENGEQGTSKEVALPLKTEEDVYQALGLQWIPPELREEYGEIEAAECGDLPTLVELGDYRGTLHCHTTWSDGADSLEEMVRAAAQDLKLEYIGICDHSQSATYARGLEIKRLHEQREAIKELNGTGDIRVLAGVECDIRPDGSLDYPDEVLEELDVVVVSIHSHFQMPEQEMTERICRALQHPCADILGHMSGRMLLMREPYAFDLERVLDTAARCKSIIEINGDPYRLDLDWRYCRSAKERGILFAVNPDAHSRAGLKNILFGLNVARKGWLTANDVVNCLGYEDLLKLLKDRREHRRKLLELH